MKRIPIITALILATAAIVSCSQGSGDNPYGKKILRTSIQVDASEDLIAASEAGSLPVRNVAVDRSSLKDDRGTDAEQLYKDAERLQQELEGGVERAADEDDYVAPPDNPKKDDTKKTDEPYKGPSVVSYSLDGRKASHLSIPAYRCMGGGLVTVIITVDNAGNVVNAKVQEDVSSADACLRNFAVRAARLSKFSKSTTAPARQTGDIIYQFIPQ